MASSGTYAYAPDIGEFVDESFERCGIDPATLAVRHIRSARRSLNLLFSSWATKGCRLFATDEQMQALTASDVDYTPASGTLAILSGVIRRAGIDTPVIRIARDQYHVIPDKTATGMPTQVFFDPASNLYFLWNAPENSTDVFRYWRLRRPQDVSTAAETPDATYAWFDALASGLAERLAMKYAPDRVDRLKGQASEAFAYAMQFDRERVETCFEPE